MNRPNSCLLVRFSYSVVIFCVTIYLLDLSFLRLFCVIVYLYVCFCCVGFSFLSTMPRDGLRRMSSGCPILCRVGRKTLIQSINQPVKFPFRLSGEVSWKIKIKRVLFFRLSPSFTTQTLPSASLMSASLFHFIVFQNKLPSPFLTAGDRSKDTPASAEVQSPADGMLYSLHGEILTIVFL